MTQHKPDCDINSNVGIPKSQKDESYCTCKKLDSTFLDFFKKQKGIYSHNDVEKIVEGVREKEQKRIIGITEEVRNECRDSDDQWDKGDECRRIQRKIEKLTNQKESLKEVDDINETYSDHLRTL